MGIDGIGKKGPPAPPSPADVKGAARAPEGARRFEVNEASPAPQAGAVEAPRTAMERLRAGEIDVNGYVQAKVDEATAHLVALPPAELEQLKDALRDRLGSDPALVDLVRKATGAVPQPPPDD
ncbi:MAG TPA: hypothetical protein VHS09_15300 [Polyangiaceae bacterium]|nr:hypothetical protein [Polyangiaceae bacterium]